MLNFQKKYADFLERAEHRFCNWQFISNCHLHFS